MRYSPEIFVDREKELSSLRKWVNEGTNVLVVGLRGYGKTSLFMKFLEEVGCDFPGVYINCLTIYTGRDLLNSLLEELETLSSRGCIDFDRMFFDALLSRTRDSRDCLNALYKLLEKHGIRFIIFDEISTLLRRLGAQKPFRGAGGAKAVAEHFKALLDRYRGISTIFADTSTNFHYELFGKYSGPLFRQYQAMLELEPLSFGDSIELIREILRKRNVGLSDNIVLYIADISGGVPAYIEMLLAIAEEGMDIREYEAEVERSLILGLLNRYFEALLDKFSWTEQEVLYAIAKGMTRFSELQRSIAGSAQALNSLVRKGVVINVKKGPRESYYLIKDKLFTAWLAIREKPGMRKISFKKARMLTIGFESLVREIFFTLKESVRIRDELGREITIEPPKKVYRYEGALGEIDMVAEYRDYVVVGEIYFGLKCGREKINQLLRHIGIAERLGYKVRQAILISYFDYPEETIGYARKISEETPILLLTEKQLRELSKYSLIRLP